MRCERGGVGDEGLGTRCEGLWTWVEDEREGMREEE